MDQIVRGITAVQSALGAINFVVLTAVVSLQVASRFILQQPLLWSEEAARFLLFWLVMNGASLAVMKQRHFTTELFNTTRITSRLFRFLLEIIPSACMLITGIIMVVYGLAYAKAGAHRTMPISQVNMMYVYLAIPISGTLIAIYSAALIGRMINTSSRE